MYALESFTSNRVQLYRTVERIARPRFVRGAFAAILFILLAGVTPSASARSLMAFQEIPELTQGAVEAFPEDLREDLRKNYEEIRQSPSDAVRVGQMGMMLHAHDQLSLAEALYSEASKLDPSAFEWAYYLAVVRENLNLGASAIEAMRAALAIRSDYIPGRLRLAELLLGSGEWDESREIYESILKEFPQLAVAHFGAGRALMELKQTQAAIEHLEKACELYEKYGQAHYALGQAYRAAGDLEKAKLHLAIFQEHRLRRPVVGDGLIDAIEALKTGDRAALERLQEGVSLGDQERFDEAIAAHVSAIELDPNLLQAYNNLVILCGKAKRYEDAQLYYQKGVETGLATEKLHYNYGVVLVAQRRFEEAARAFETALQIDPLDPGAHANLGQMYMQLGDLEKATRSFESAIKSDPGYREAHFNLGRIRFAEGDLWLAAAEFEKALEPEDEATPRYRYALGAVYVRLREFDRALPILEKALEGARQYNQEDLVKVLDRDLKLVIDEIAARKALIEQQSQPPR